MVLWKPINRRRSSLGDVAQSLYDAKLKSLVEPQYIGKAIAIHIDSEDYAIGDSHGDAAQKFLQRHSRDGRIVTLTIGPPTDSDLRLASRMLSGSKR